MKLLFCRECHDIVALNIGRRRYCRCKASSGKYQPDGWHADVYGAGIMLGFNNDQLFDLQRACDAPEPRMIPFNNRYPRDAYEEFTLFVQPPWHPQAHYHKSSP